MMINLKKITFIIWLFSLQHIVSQSIEVTSFNQNPIEVSDLLGADLTINFQYTSQNAATSNNIYIGLEELNAANQFVRTIDGISLTNQTAGTNIQSSVTLFISSVHPLTANLPSGHYYQVIARLYTNNWGEIASAGYWSVPQLITQNSNPYTFSTKTIANGADISWMTEMEANGFTWKDNNGNTKALMPLLKEYDLDVVRLRVWVNPATSGANGWCDIDDLVAKAELAKNNNLEVMVCIHYSDWWADPGQQNKPAAWNAFTVAQLETAVANHTTQILTALQAKNITPKWVQIGNETNDGMLWNTGKASTGGFANYAKFINAGSNAAKTFNSNIKTILHLANGFNRTELRWNLNGLFTNGFNAANIDIIGLSLYPTLTDWKTKVDEAAFNMLDLRTSFSKDVMMVEVGFENSRPDIAYQFLTYMIEKTKLSNGLGVLYWEPIAYNNWNSYSKGAWDADGSPSVAMDAFKNRTTLSVENFDENSLMSTIAYPNPTNQLLHLKNNKTLIYSVKITDVLGKEVFSKNFNNQQVSIDVTDLQSGIYFVVINNSEKIKLLKSN